MGNGMGFGLGALEPTPKRGQHAAALQLQCGTRCWVVDMVCRGGGGGGGGDCPASALPPETAAGRALVPPLQETRGTVPSRVVGRSLPAAASTSKGQTTIGAPWGPPQRPIGEKDGLTPPGLSALMWSWLFSRPPPAAPCPPVP